MSRSTTEPISVKGAQIGVEVRGSAEPVVLVQTAFASDEVVPLLSRRHTLTSRSWLVRRPE